jgi:two-component system cell cycle response regulator DivK
MTSSDKHKILIIDDDPGVVTFLEALMQDNGHETVTAANGAEGLEKVHADRPDLILLDITMPEKTGVRFYRDVRENEALATIPVVMVTGVMKEFKKFIHTRRKVPPPDGYITKPIDQQELLETVTRLLATSN